MKEVARVINAIGKTSSYNDKLLLLKANSETPGLKEILKFIYNPYCKTGISDKKLDKALLMTNDDYSGVTWQDAIDYFSKHQTGSDADLTYAAMFIKSNPEADWLAVAIVTQDLKIGITATSLNKAYGANFIPKTGCMLGTLFADVPAYKIKWPCIVTEKLDGIRRILVKENGIVRCYSRSGHEDTGLVDIIEEAKYLPDNRVYDGELLAIGKFKDSIALRQATNSIANSKGIKRGLTFNVFDSIPIDEFYAGASKEDALKRKIWLGATLKDTSINCIDEDYARRIAAFGIDEDLIFIKPVPVLGIVHSLIEAEPIVQVIWDNGGEGIMLNTTAGKYEIKRSKELLKVKHTEEHVLTVVDVVEGTGKFEDSLGAVIVQYKGSYVGVGSGFTDAQRQHIWDNPELYVGRKIEVECFGESINAQGFVSLNCPIFQRFVGMEE